MTTLPLLCPMIFPLFSIVRLVQLWILSAQILCSLDILIVLKILLKLFSWWTTTLKFVTLMLSSKAPFKPLLLWTKISMAYWCLIENMSGIPLLMIFKIFSSLIPLNPLKHWITRLGALDPNLYNLNLHVVMEFYKKNI